MKERYRSEVVKTINSWIGKKESDGSYMSIINIYNSYGGPFPRGLKMNPSWAWCACTWSAVAIHLDYTDIMPIEISCGELIKAAQKMGCWMEDDSYIPSPGDGILYDWDDNGVGDNIGWPDHIGIVIGVDKAMRTINVVEGNYNDAVKTRVIPINGRYIRGFIVPKYTEEKKKEKSIKDIAKEVIEGQWGFGDDRKKRLKKAGYDYNKVQKKVNELLKK